MSGQPSRHIVAGRRRALKRSKPSPPQVFDSQPSCWRDHEHSSTSAAVPWAVPTLHRVDIHIDVQDHVHLVQVAAALDAAHCSRAGGAGGAWRSGSGLTALGTLGAGKGGNIKQVAAALNAAHCVQQAESAGGRSSRLAPLVWITPNTAPLLTHDKATAPAATLALALPATPCPELLRHGVRTAPSPTAPAPPLSNFLPSGSFSSTSKMSSSICARAILLLLAA